MTMHTPEQSARRPDISICVALIHNNNQTRNSIIKPNIEELCEFLGNTCEVRSIEVSYQPKITPLSPQLTLDRKLIAQQLTNDWAIYREQEPSSDAAPLSITTQEQRSGAIEMVLTDKHIRVWSEFLESPCEFLLCFEDDAIFLHSSEQRLVEVLKQAKAHGEGANLYVDLAGGCTIPGLGVGQLFDRREKDFIYFRKPVTNTACTYLLNRSMVEDFMEMLVFQPTLRYTPADWLMNKLLIEIDKLGRKTACFHLDPPVFEHGSAKGIWPSTRS
jgi:hypothetical protein